MHGAGGRSRRARARLGSSSYHCTYLTVVHRRLRMDVYHLRVRLFTGIIVAVLTLLGLRLVQLQLIDTQEYSGASRNNAVREQRVLPARGVIYDREDRLVVDNTLAYTITITPRYFDPERTGLLAELLEVPDSVVTAELDEAKRWSPFLASRAFPDVTFEQFSRIQENQYRLPGVGHVIGQKRRYVTEANAAHALGYIREITRNELEQRRELGYRQGDLVGKAGVELRYEPYLRGEVGSEFKLVNIHGREVTAYRDGVEDTPPVSGFDVHLTLDSDIQALAESLFVDKRGGAVALDVNTGEILALVSKPDYDPSIFSGTVPADAWEYLTTSRDKPMFNRATMSGLPPGSTWKPFMAVLGLQEGVITPDSRIHCPGYHPLGRGRFFRCMGVHGSLDVETAIEKSCNTFFFEVMMRTDVNTFSRYAHMFGFGEKAPTDLLEQQPGIIPDSAYFNRTYPRGWTPGYSINLGIGQGNMVTTPLQLARYAAAIANGGTLHPPHIVRYLENPETGERVEPDLPTAEQIPIEPAYFEIARAGMRRVMENGTGRLSQIPAISSGGKTGTAQAPPREDHSIFVMFAPYDDPQIALAVMVENAGGGSRAAAPIASFMAEQFLADTLTMTPNRRFILNRLNETVSEPLEDIVRAQQPAN